jgi:hypothetical protein
VLKVGSKVELAQSQSLCESIIRECYIWPWLIGQRRAKTQKGSTTVFLLNISSG